MYSISINVNLDVVVTRLKSYFLLIKEPMRFIMTHNKNIIRCNVINYQIKRYQLNMDNSIFTRKSSTNNIGIVEYVEV